MPEGFTCLCWFIDRTIESTKGNLLKMNYFTNGSVHDRNGPGVIKMFLL